MKTLLIVESPHKVKAVAALAKPAIKGTVIAWACLGHLRDLPEDRLGIDIRNGFIPEYRIPKHRVKTVASLRSKIQQADIVLLATDPDREGEAVAWHITRIYATELNGKTVRRITFNAITDTAIQAALKHPRSLDMHLITAAIARRVLDRLVGYFISPWLWKTFPYQKDLSAGRVQTTALRLLVEYERARPVPSETWTVEVEL
jgi:DNA topoisomerase-1